MQQIVPWLLVIVLGAVVVWLVLERNDLKIRLYGSQVGYKAACDQRQEALDFAAEWRKRYEDLVKDVKQIAMRPQVVAHPEDPHKPRKAASSAAIRKMFDQENAKVLAEKEI